MSRELERHKIPVAHICTMINVSKGMGGNRLIPSCSVLYPTGDPQVSYGEELIIRNNIVQKALRAIKTEIKDPTVFDD